MKKYFWRNFILIFSVAVITLVIQLGMLILQYRSSRSDWTRDVFNDFRAEVEETDFPSLSSIGHYMEIQGDNRVSGYRVTDSQGRAVLMPPPSGSFSEGEFAGSLNISADEGLYTVELYSFRPGDYIYTRNLIRSCVRSIIISVPICLVIAVVLSYLISRNNTRTVNGIRKALSELAGGKHDVKVGNAQRSEMEEIASDIEALGRTLESDSRSRKAWLTGISHDLSTPATGIKMISDGLIDGLFEADAETLENLRHESDTLNERISRVAEYAGLQSCVLKKRSISCSEFASHMVSFFPDKKFETGFSDGAMFADIEVMEKACAELLKNAFTYGYDVSLEVESNCIRVFNTGYLPQGLEGEILFEPWVRGDSSRHDGGTGLGLAIAATAASLHGGTAELKTVSEARVCAFINWPL